MKRRHKRLILIIIIGAALILATGLVLIALRDRVTYFYSPSDIVAHPPAPHQTFRLGGLVAANSVTTNNTGATEFAVTDNDAIVHVTFTGILPDLFREGQGVVAIGRYSAIEHNFTAQKVLAKHDENYMPPEVYKNMREKTDTLVTQ